MLRVLHCVGSMNRAGIETFIMNMYRKINRDQVQFDFQCANSSSADYDSEIRQLGGKILYLDNDKYSYPSIFKYFGILMRNIDFYKRYPEYKIVHIHNHHAFDALIKVIACKLTGVKVIIVHSHNSEAPHPILNRLCSVLLNIMHVQKYACSNSAGQWLFGKKAYFQIINNGIDIQRFVFDEDVRIKTREKLNISPETLVFIHVGRFEKQKNHSFLIDLMHNYVQLNSNCILLLVGNGNLQREVKSKVHKLNLESYVMFLGVRDDIPDLLDAADLFLLPSYYEGLPVVGVEAQASGLNCIFSDSITKEIGILSSTKYFPLSVGPVEWSKYIEQTNYNVNRKHLASRIIECGFSNEEVARKLYENYIAFAKEAIVLDD